MQALVPVLITLVLASACTTSPGPRRSEVRNCPVGMVLICETRKDQQLSRGGEEEIPEYEHCYCEQIN
jgi:hypothetical protein